MSCAWVSEEDYRRHWLGEEREPIEHCLDCDAEIPAGAGRCAACQAVADAQPVDFEGVRRG